MSRAIIVLAVVGLCVACSNVPKCDSEVCPLWVSVCWLEECHRHSNHAHATTYSITYSNEDLRFNKTRTDIRNWLKTWVAE